MKIHKKELISRKKGTYFCWQNISIEKHREPIQKKKWWKKIHLKKKISIETKKEQVLKKK